MGNVYYLSRIFVFCIFISNRRHHRPFPLESSAQIVLWAHCGPTCRCQHTDIMGCLSSKVATDVVEEIVAETMETAGDVAKEAVEDIVEETIGETPVATEDTAAEADDAGAIPRPVVAVRDDE